LILPTTLPVAAPQAAGDFWARSTLVRADDIRGKVYLRTQPFERFGALTNR
jgi:hypothetical protein